MVAKRRALRCKGHRPDGSPCPNYAMAGQEVCSRCGGKSPQAKRKAAERITEAKAVEVFRRYSPDGGAPADVPQALAAILAEIRHFAAFMGDRLAEFTAEEWHYSHPDRDKILAEVRVYERAIERAGRILVDIGRLGIEAAIVEQQGRLERARAERIVAAFDAVVASLPLSADDRQRALGRFAFELMHLGVGGGD
jgi:hypothetical protein